MSIMPKAKKLQVSSSNVRNNLIVIAACLCAVRFRAIRQEGSFLIDIYLAKEVLVHEIEIALVIFLRESFVLIQINCCNL